MGYDICELDTGNNTVRVDTWDATGRHWIYYFRKEDGEQYELYATADVPYEGDRMEMEFGISSAEEKMKKEGFSVSPYQG